MRRCGCGDRFRTARAWWAARPTDDETPGSAPRARRMVRNPRSSVFGYQCAHRAPRKSPCSRLCHCQDEPLDVLGGVAHARLALLVDLRQQVDRSRVSGAAELLAVVAEHFECVAFVLPEQ